MGQLFLILSFIAQVYFIYHAMVRKKYLWAAAILFFPFFGLLGYYFMEYRNQGQRNFRMRETVKAADNIFQSKMSLRDLNDRYEAAPSFVNKIALADGLQRADRFEEAIDLYESATGGMNEEDLNLWQGLAHAYFHTQQFKKAADAVKQLRKYRDSNQVNDFDLILARSLEELGEYDAALFEYEYMAGKYGGEEARCRYALLLKKMGDEEGAQKIFKEMINHSRLSPAYYKRNNQQWISIASKELSLK